MKCLQKAEITESLEQSGSNYTYAPRRSSAEPLLRSLHWQPVAQSIKYKIATLTHRALTTGQPPYLLIRNIAAQNVASYNSVDQHGATCRPRLSFGIYTKGIPYWSTNRLEHTIELRRRLSSTGFKTGLKNFLFDAANSKSTGSRRLWILGRTGAI